MHQVNGARGRMNQRLRATVRINEYEPLVPYRGMLTKRPPCAQVEIQGEQCLAQTDKCDRHDPPFRLRRDDSCSWLGECACC